MAVLSVVLFTLAIGFLGVLAMIIRHITYWRFRGIPFVETVPLIGFLFPAFIRKKSFSDLMIDTYNACPGAKYFGCMDLATPLLVIKDPEIVKEIAVKSFNNFPNHLNFVPEAFDPLMSKNLFSLKDDRWREMRTVLTPAFTANKMKFMFQLVSKCSMDFVEYMTEHPELMKELDLNDVYTRYTNDVIATTAFGISVNSLKDRNNEFYVNGKLATTFEGFANFLKFILARMFPKFLHFIGLRSLPRKADRFFKTLINDTVKTRDQQGIVRPDMIHLMMRARDNDSGIEVTNDDIIAQAVIFFFAGFDTTARLMCFVSHILSHNPDIQDRLREEVDATLAEGDGIITYETLHRMKYMDMVVSETLRLYPPQPFMDRVCSQSYELPPSTDNSKSYTVSPNMLLWIPVLGFHRDPNYFPEPDKFDPERFSEERKNEIKPYTYMPFGLGPRKCIGDRFALMETKILIAHLLQHFIFKASDKTTEKVTFSTDGGLMMPKNGFWMMIKSRKSALN